MRDIALRGFINDKFNTPFGKGLFRRAVFNGLVELSNPNQKYLVDFYQPADWQNLAKTDAQMASVRELFDSGFDDEAEVFCSWVQHYDPLSKTKTQVDGFAIYCPTSQELYIKINDVPNGTNEDWTLPARLCKTAGAHKPVFVATNVDLNAQTAQVTHMASSQQQNALKNSVQPKIFHAHNA